MVGVTDCDVTGSAHHWPRLGAGVRFRTYFQPGPRGWSAQVQGRRDGALLVVERAARWTPSSTEIPRGAQGWRPHQPRRDHDDHRRR